MTKLLSRFRADRRANVAMIFALVLLPLFGLIGAAVDYSRSSVVQARLQAALDAASLALAKDSRRLSGAALQEAANKALAGFLSSLDRVNLGTLRVSKTGNAVRLEIDGAVETTLSSAVGVRSIPVSVVSQTVWNEPRIEIALVLDNTGSMSSSGKMAALRTAALDLINELEAARVSTDQVKIAIVPFDTQVNIGTAYRNESWLRFDADGINSTLTPWVQTTTKSQWQGCIADRDQPYDTNDTEPASKATLFRAVRCATGSLAAAQPLTTSFAPLRTTINAMQPSGMTNITIGLQVGLAMLSPRAPFTQTGTEPDVLRYMILLTDGDNTENRFVSTTRYTRDSAYSASSSPIDARTTLACNTVKAAGITLFTVRVIEGNQTLLRNCASDPSMYFNVTSSGGIGDAFKAITSMIRKMRLSV